MKRDARCGDVVRELDDFVGGILPAAEAERLRIHAALCARCARRVRVRAALREALSPPAEIELPSGFRESLVARLTQAGEENPEAVPASLAGLRTRPRPSPFDRAAEIWAGLRLAPRFGPVAAVAASVVAVVLVYATAQVVGTRRGPFHAAPVQVAGAPQAPAHSEPAGGISPAPSAPEASPTRAHDLQRSEAPLLVRGGAPREEGGSSHGTIPAPDRGVEAVPAGGPVELAAVEPVEHSVVGSSGLDVVAAFGGARLDPRQYQIVVRMDGLDVTRGSRVTPDYVVYTPASGLPEGRHAVDVEVRAPSGERRDLHWEFYVLQTS